jgi:23S rRNA (uracil1939-C5)-methyltransferase
MTKLQLTIEKLVYGGDGLARGDAAEQGRRPAVFLPFVLPGEVVEARVIERKPKLLRARAERIVEASPARVEPACPYFAKCGGCQYQHAAYECQLQSKAEILTETVRRLAKVEPPRVEAHGSPPWSYRNRTRLKVRSVEAAGGETRRSFALGFHRPGTHELLAVEQCPISSPLINRAIGALWKLGRAGLVPEPVQEIELFANAQDDALLAEVTLPEAAWKRRWQRSLGEFSAALRQALPETAGVAAFCRMANGELRRAEVPDAFRESLGSAELRYHVAGGEYLVSAGSFFQTNRHMAETLAELVAGGRSGQSAMDLYAGVGLFTLPLARRFERVTAVEAAESSVADLRRNAPANVRCLAETTERYLAALAAGTTVDLVVADPPRAGLGERCAQLLTRLAAPRITYVSCDPATLARDLKALTAGGYRIEQMHLVDLFPQTFHLESVTQLVR